MRARLLDAALTVASQKGPARTSIDDVIAAADVSRGTFYKYFDSTEKLISAMAVEVAADLVRLVDPVLQVYDDPAVRIALGARTALTLVAHHRVLGGLLVQVGWPVVPDSALFFAVLERDLTAGMDSGRFKLMPHQVAINLIAGSLVGGMQNMMHNATPGYPGQAALAILRALGLPEDEAEQICRMPLPLPPIAVDGILGRAMKTQLT
jgi:AcrR family transcriptional regulator